MYTPNRLAKIFKETFTSTKNNEPDEIKDTTANSSLEWSDNKEMICIKKTEYESLQIDIFNKTEIIKRLKNTNEDNKSVILEYEEAFKSISKGKVIDSNMPNLLDELERLRSSEDRLKAHIQALKRDLITCEEKMENEILYKDQQIDNFKSEIEDLKNTIKRQISKIQETEFANVELKIALQRKCENLIEITTICSELMKECS